MKANELRIGNIVLRKEFLHSNLENCRFDKIVVTHNDINACHIYNRHFEPIPLTEEWLFKFRFVYNPHSSEFHGKNMIFHNWIKDRGYVSWGSTQIKYVHQLQNLYFALTGEELTYGGNK